MKIIRKSESPPWWLGQVIECCSCGCIVELEEGDSFGPMSYISGNAVEMSCPECNFCETYPRESILEFSKDHLKKVNIGKSELLVDRIIREHSEVLDGQSAPLREVVGAVGVGGAFNHPVVIEDEEMPMKRWHGLVFVVVVGLGLAVYLILELLEAW